MRRSFPALGLLVIVVTIACEKPVLAQDTTFSQLAVGERDGIWVGTAETLTDLLHKGFEIKFYQPGNDLTLLQKGSSLYKCDTPAGLFGESSRTACDQMVEAPAAASN